MKLASDLFVQYIDSKLNPSNAGVFLSVLNRLMNQDEKDEEVLYKICNAVYAKRESLSRDYIHTIDSNYLYFCVKYELNTDDSFAFAKLCRCLSEKINTLSTGDIDEYRFGAILSCLEKAYKKYHFSWAKNSIETVFRDATQQRGLLTENQKEGLDKLTNRLEIER